VSLLEPRRSGNSALIGKPLFAMTLIWSSLLSLSRTVACPLAEAIVTRLNEGKAVAVHCRAGIGRSSLIAACVLVLLGFAPGMAFDRIGKPRGVKVPDTGGQRDWVDMFREAAKTGGIHPA
jgi:hypothetical protein